MGSMDSIDSIIADLERILGAFDMLKHGLGEEALDIVAQGVGECLEAEQSPDGTPWKELSEAYAEWKAKEVGAAPMAVLYRDMTSPGAIRGEHDIAKDEAIYTFGNSYISKLHASYFQDPTGPGQPPRPFVGLGRTTIGRLDNLFDRRFDDAVEGR
jgi:hypothetical protein